MAVRSLPNLGSTPQFASERRKLLSLIGDELHIWSRTFGQRHGFVTPPTLSRGADAEEDEFDDVDEPAVVERENTDQ